MDMTHPAVNRETTSAANSAAASNAAAASKPATDAPAVTPAVDIFEDEQGITLKADLPGVSKENLNVRVEAGQLTVEGQVSLGESTSLAPVYAEVRRSQYRRSFTLSRDLDTDKIEANLRNGVLTLRIPKAEQAKPRRVEVRIG